jgi:hypothetical protein
MRTTLVLDDDVFRRAKTRSAELGSTLSEFVEQALRDVLASKPPEKPRPFVFRTCGDPNGVEDVSPARIKQLADDDDAFRYGSR